MIPTCEKASSNTGGRFMCKREANHIGPCVAVSVHLEDMLEHAGFINADQLGKRNREAFYRAIDGCAREDEWETLSKDERMAWVCAAFAVRGL